MSVHTLVRCRFAYTIAIVAAIVLPARAAWSQGAVAVEGSNVTWSLDPRSAKVDQHLGRRALFLRGQSPPAFADVEFIDGTIEFDIAPLPGGNFAGLVFRYASPSEHENVYLRLHKSGAFDAMQYAPRIFTTAGIWQLTREFMAPVRYTPDSWLHVRAEVSGSRLEIFVGDSAKPTVVVPRMRGVTSTGRIGFWGRVNEKPDEWTAALSNIVIRPRRASPITLVADTTVRPTGTLTGWVAAGPYDAPDSASAPPFPTQNAWQPLPLEEYGLLNISRHFRKPAGGRHVVFLRNRIASANRTTVPLDVSYSDDAIIWLNGELIYRGSNGFNSRYPGNLGLTGAAVETVYLPLKAGTNELVLAIGERAFGWGLRARLQR